jgi:diguanylate cyclase (GGDEF)-like protein/PAS domain S-box-containing protein
MLSMAIGGAWLGYKETLDDFSNHTKQTVAAAASILNNYSEANGATNVQLISLILGKNSVAAAFEAKDREKLYDLTAPILKKLKDDLNADHLYFINSDRRVLLRVHSPSTYGDIIDRQTMVNAATTGRPSSGFEIGVFGHTRHRTVFPWKEAGKVKGYIEIARDFDSFLSTIRKIIDADIVLLVDRALIGSAGVSKKASTSAYLSVATTLPHDSDIDSLLPQLNEGGAPQNVTLGSRLFVASLVPFRDSTNVRIGQLAVLVESTSLLESAKNTALFTGGAALLLCFSLLLAARFLLGRYHGDLLKAERQLLVSDERYSLALKAANEGIYDVTVETGELFVSERVEEIFGFPASGMKCVEDWLGRVVPEDRDRYRKEAGDYFRGRTSSLITEYRIIDHHGQVRWIAERAQATRRPEDNRVVRLVGSVSDVTELKKTEGALLSSNDRFRELAEMSSDWFWEQDENFRYTFVSGGFSSMIQSPSDFVIGKTRWEISSLDVNAVKWNEHRRILESHLPFNDLELVIPAADGIVRFMSISGRPIFDQNGIFRGYRGSGRDITKIKAAEQALRQANESLEERVHERTNSLLHAKEEVAQREEKLVAIMNTVADSIVTIDTNGVIQSCNRATERVFGWNSAELIGRNVGVLMPEPHASRHDGYIANYLDSGKAYVVGQQREVVGKRKNGKEFPLEIAVSELKIGETHLFTAVIRDITRRKQFERDLSDKTALLEATLDNITQAVVIFDVGLRLLGCNRLFLSMYDLPVTLPLVRPHLSDLLRMMSERGIAVGNATPEMQILKHAGQGGEIAFTMIERDLANGSVVQVDARRLNDGRTLITNTDVTDLKRREEALRKSDERYALAARGANDGLWDWDLQSGSIYYSPRWKTMLGLGEDEGDNTSAFWFSRIHPDDADILQAALDAHIGNVTPHLEVEYRMRHLGDNYVWVLTRGLAVFDPNNGQVVRISGSQTDITARKRTEQQLLHDAFHDGLTGMSNRALFLDRLGQALSRVKRDAKRSFAVLFIDIDRFKYVNDTLGHSAGDGLIIAIARRIEECIRATDTAARLGGDEFAILLDDIPNVEEASNFAARLMVFISQKITLRNQEIFPTVSVGVAFGTGDYERPEDVLSDADLAMYRAKESGKACYAVFDESLRAYSSKSLTLVAEMHRAYERNEFSLFYQPIVAASTGIISGFEALIRWRHPERGMISPLDFIPLAEETGLIVPIGWWVIEEASRQLTIWRERYPAHRNLHVAINISARQFKDNDLVENIARHIKGMGAASAGIKLEITESLLMDNPEVAAEWLHRLKALGLSLSIDDFGTGYSSLSYLHRFPFDTLKIDRSFIMSMLEKRENAEIVRAIIDLAHTIGIRVVAEGVEKVEELAMLRGRGCDFVQGYFFSRPLAGEDAEKLLVSQPEWL